MWSRTKEFYRKLTPFFSSVTHAGAHLLWPGRCMACQESVLPADEGFCASCWRELSQAVSGDYCRRCGRDVSPFGVVAGRCGHCQDQTFEYDGLVRVGRYESTLRAMILGLKFAERTEWLTSLAQMLEQTLTASGWTDRADCIVPVPLHWRRRLRRGFNQSYLLSRVMNLPGVAISTDLVRIRNTEQQWNLKPSQRRRNVKGAFAVRKGHPFQGKSVLLVDDISTSGATLTECAKTLKQAGAKTVLAAVVATAFHDVADNTANFQTRQPARSDTAR